MKNTKYKILNTKYRKSKGFTLIELLVVISIIALLVATATASWRNAQMKGRDGKRKADLKAVQQALENYLQTYGVYPTAADGLITCSGGAAGAGTATWGTGIFRCPASGGPIFMQQMPQDPAYQSDANKGYFYSSTATTYSIWAAVENSNDPDIPPKATLPSGCGAVPGLRNFCVINP